MTPEQIEQERAAFEAWYSPEEALERNPIGGYSDLFAAVLFKVWLARAEQTGWIRVEDRLPEESGRFLVRYESTSEETPYTTIVRYNAENRTFRSLFLRIDQENPITHWQPLPQPPEGATA